MKSSEENQLEFTQSRSYGFHLVSDASIFPLESISIYAQICMFESTAHLILWYSRALFVTNMRSRICKLLKNQTRAKRPIWGLSSKQKTEGKTVFKISNSVENYLLPKNQILF